MKKSIFATFFMLFGLFAAPVLYAADELPEIAPTADEPLPPMVDPSIADDASSK